MSESEAGLPPSTPVIVGVGQSADHVGAPDYHGWSAVELAAEAARTALADTGADSATVAGRIDVLAVTRTFEDSIPGAPAPLGKSDNPPRSIAARIGADPARAILEISGGQSPQSLVREFCGAIARGEAHVVLLAGAEAISTTRQAAQADPRPDFSESVGGQLEDRGLGLKGLVSRQHMEHQLVDAPSQYALAEHARRHRLGLSRQEYAESMGELFAPFTRVAAANPLSASQEERSAAELVEVTERNRMIADPYPRFLVARDQVNLGAAVLLMSLGTAESLGIDPARFVYVHGTAALVEQPQFERPDLGASPAAGAAVRHALEVAGAGVDDVTWWDLYSCFPVAVSNVCDELGLAPDDPRGLTVTGGLPFFGGPGNNYSMHAIAEIVERARRADGYGVVGANGGLLSKYSVGVYSRQPRGWVDDDSAAIQAELDAADRYPFAHRADGWATIETYTVIHRRTGAQGVVVGRLEADGRRFLALPAENDPAMTELLSGADEPIGQRVFVRSYGYGNRVTTRPELVAPRPPAFRESYEFATVERRGRVLEVTIDRPEARNALHPPANEELADIFDAFFADPDLWVAILTGAGDSAFCAGNDLMYSASGKPMYIPAAGFAGLTSRRGMHKPVIAAVNGFAMGGGFETALACHVVVVDEAVQLALSEVQVGLIAGAGGLVRLPRMIPPKVANELILTGRRIGAEEASRLGLASRVAPQGKALDVAREIADQIASVSPTSVRLSLQLMEETDAIPDVVDAVSYPSPAIDELMTSADMIEGMTAFAMKRPPRWSNR